MDGVIQKWNLQKSACDDGVKIELRPVFAQFGANLSFPVLRMLLSQKWHLQKSASDDGVKIELRPVLAQFKANLSFPTPGMLLSGL